MWFIYGHLLLLFFSTTDLKDFVEELDDELNNQMDHLSREIDYFTTSTANTLSSVVSIITIAAPYFLSKCYFCCTKSTTITCTCSSNSTSSSSNTRQTFAIGEIFKPL